MENLDAAAYYRLTEDSYRRLTPDTTPFMNLGLWPAAGIRDAQAALVRRTLAFGRDVLRTRIARILEIGPGWGGGRALVAEAFPAAAYVGLNCSIRQIDYAMAHNAAYPDTQYRQGFAENIGALALPRPDLVLGIESVLHVADRQALFQDLHASGAKAVLLADICVEDRPSVLAEPLFTPSLSHTGSVASYASALTAAGFNRLEIVDLGPSVFVPWATALREINDTEYQGHPRVLRQFRKSYDALASFAQAGLVRYVLIAAEVNR